MQHVNYKLNANVHKSKSFDSIYSRLRKLCDLIVIIAFDACSSNAILAEEQCVKLTYFKSILFGVFFLCVYVCLISFHYIHVVYVVSLQGLFSRITFREPVFLGGTGNITGLAKRLPVSVGMTGCIRKFVANEHEYVFAATPSGDVVQGFDIRKYCNFIFFSFTTKTIKKQKER